MTIYLPIIGEVISLSQIKDGDFFRRDSWKRVWNTTSGR